MKSAAANIEEEEKPNLNITPILLFSVCRKNGRNEEKRGVYYVPQKGVALEGIQNDWSVLTVVRHIESEHFQEFEPQEIDPGDLEEKSIVRALATWMSTDDVADVKEDQEDGD